MPTLLDLSSALHPHGPHGDLKEERLCPQGTLVGFVDDNNCVVTALNIESLETATQLALDNMESHMTASCLKINKVKTHLLLMASKADKERGITVCAEGKVLPTESFYYTLGATVQDDLHWNKTVASLSRQLHQWLTVLRCLAQWASRQTQKGGLCNYNIKAPL